ncbi:MAG TPA: hypothetical protein VFH51_08490, partial [Myxococcota bacterium]|nr:hypothetical protein [Myxococcota bacterium]
TLGRAVEEGLLVPAGHRHCHAAYRSDALTYEFAEDAAWRVARASGEARQAQAVHGAIGLDWRVDPRRKIEAARHLNRGLHRDSKLRAACVAANIVAAAEARRGAAYELAAEFLLEARRILREGPRSAGTQQLQGDVARELAAVYALAGRTEHAAQYVQEALDANPAASLRAEILGDQALLTPERDVDAVLAQAAGALEHWKIPLPLRPGPLRLLGAVLRALVAVATARLWQRNAPPPGGALASRLLALVCRRTEASRPALHALAALRLLQLTGASGAAAHAATAYVHAAVAARRCRVMWAARHLVTAAQAGLSGQGAGSAGLRRLLLAEIDTPRHRPSQIRDKYVELCEALRHEGDWLGLTLAGRGLLRAEISMSLQEGLWRIESIGQSVGMQVFPATQTSLVALRQMCLCLIGGTAGPATFGDGIYVEEEALARLVREGDRAGLHAFHTCKALASLVHD